MEGVAAREEQLGDEDVVVRGGRMSAATMAASAEKEKIRSGRPSLSCWSFPAADASAVARLARVEDPDALPHSTIRWTTVRALRQLSYDLVQTDQPGHYSLMLPDPPTDRDWANLDQVFSDAQPNPVALAR